MKGMSMCGLCNMGFFSFEAAEKCSKCLPGTFTHTKGNAKCTDCPKGTWAKGEMNNECKPSAFVPKNLRGDSEKA